MEYLGEFKTINRTWNFVCPTVKNVKASCENCSKDCEGWWSTKTNTVCPEFNPCIIINEEKCSACKYCQKDCLYAEYNELDD